MEGIELDVAEAKEDAEAFKRILIVLNL